MTPGQEGFVAPNAVSVAQACFQPEAFYRRFGFEPTGEVSEGEHVMRLAL